MGVTCSFVGVTWSFDAVTCSFDAVTWSFNAVTCSFDAVTCSFDAVTCSFDAVTCSFDAITFRFVIPKWWILQHINSGGIQLNRRGANLKLCEFPTNLFWFCISFYHHLQATVNRAFKTKSWKFINSMLTRYLWIFKTLFWMHGNMLFMNFQNFVLNARLTVACKWL